MTGVTLEAEQEIRARDLRIEKLETVLETIVMSWECRSELYRSEADCAAGLADHARLELAP